MKILNQEKTEKIVELIMLYALDIARKGLLKDVDLK